MSISEDVPVRNSKSLEKLIQDIKARKEKGEASQTDGKEEDGTMEDVAKLIGRIKYLVDEWIPRGMLTGIVAEPGIGKSSLALNLIKSLTTGSPWFNGTTGPTPSKVVWCPTEGDMAITLERMIEWGIPYNGMLILNKQDPTQSTDLTDHSHLRRIEELLVKYKSPAFFVDSLRGGHDTDENNSKVGRILQNLSAISERTGASGIIVHHTRKLMIDEEATANSCRGSNAILANFRSMIGIDIPTPEDKWRRIRMLKENLGLAPDPIRFRFVKGVGLEFEPMPLLSLHTSKSIQHTPPTNKNIVSKVEKWLVARLQPAGNWCAAKQLEEEASILEFEKTGTLQRARKNLHITQQEGNIKRLDSAWWWRLPQTSPR